MLIGIEAERANLGQKTGVENYAKQLILHLAEIDKVNNYRLYLRTNPEAWFLKLPKNFELRVLPFPIFWTQLRISLEMLLNPVDALFVPASALPIIHPSNSVVTVHDLAWKFYPKTFTTFTKWFLNWSTGFSARGARKVIAVSKSTKKDLVSFYNIPEKKVSVVYHGYDKEAFGELKTNLKLPNKYVLFLSTLQPRKNLEGLIDAFRLLKKSNPDLPHKLVVVGGLGWKFESILKKIEENKDIVEYLNYISDNDRRYVLQHAEVLVQPAFYEGFGIQALDALAVGVPLACSNVSSLPEVAGEAAVYFDPHNILDIKNAISSILYDQSLKDSLKQKGQLRLKEFSWEKCAEQTLRVLTNVD